MVAKKLTGVVVLLLVLLLTGCSGEVATDLYVQDIMDIVTGEEETLFTTATITLESPGEEYHEQVVSLLEQNFRDVTNARTISHDISTYLAVDVRLPVLELNDNLELWLGEDPIGIMVMDLDDGAYGFALALDSDQLDEMFAALSDDFWFPVGVQDFSFSVKLINDLREPVEVGLQGVYANNVPLAYEEYFELQRRDTIDIRLSDVMRDYVYEEWMVLLGVLWP